MTQREEVLNQAMPTVVCGYVDLCSLSSYERQAMTARIGQQRPTIQQNMLQYMSRVAMCCVQSSVRIICAASGTWHHQRGQNNRQLERYTGKKKLNVPE